MESYFYVDRRLITPRKKKNSFLIFIPVLVITVILIFIVLSRTDKTTIAQVPEIMPSPTSSLKSFVAQDTTKKISSLAPIVEAALADSKGTYGIVIKNLKTNEKYEFNSHEKFESASLYKLWVLGEVFSQIEQGILTPDQTLSQDVATLNKKFRIASDSAELSEGRITRTVSDALFRMITYSDNYSALLLTEKIKLTNLSNFLRVNNLSESSIGTGGANPQTTAADVAFLLERIYEGQLGSKENDDEMLGLLKQQTINGKIPKLLPEGSIIAHKTGELGSVSHDAGIVYTPKGDYVIVVLSDTNSKLGADARIAQISKGVYDYFTQ